MYIASLWVWDSTLRCDRESYLRPIESVDESGVLSLKLKLDDLVLLPLALEALFVRTALNIGVGGDIFNASNFSCVCVLFIFNVRSLVFVRFCQIPVENLVCFSFSVLMNPPNSKCIRRACP